MDILGMRSVIYPAPDLQAQKAWFTELLGVGPYFDEPFYVGFLAAGYEIGLWPDADPARGALAYWGVPDADAAFAELLRLGATELGAVREVGEGIRLAEVIDPSGSVFAIIENPHFALPDPPPAGDGPGR